MQMKNPKTLVLVYGCFSRSFNITQSNHHRRVFAILENADLDFEVIHLDNLVEEIDGIRVAGYNHDQDTVLQKVILEQPRLDSKIRSDYPNYRRFFNTPYYTDQRKLFAMRNSLLETMVASLLNKFSSDFKYAIVYNSDFWFDKPWRVDWVKNKDVIISDQNPGNGLTNGFYSGPINSVSKLLDSFGTLEETAGVDFERILLENSRKKGVRVTAIPFRFLKIRASKRPAYMDFPFWPKIQRIQHDYYLRASIPFRMKLFHFLCRTPIGYVKSIYRKSEKLIR